MWIRSGVAPQTRAMRININSAVARSGLGLALGLCLSSGCGDSGDTTSGASATETTGGGESTGATDATDGTGGATDSTTAGGPGGSDSVGETTGSSTDGPETSSTSEDPTTGTTMVDPTDGDPVCGDGVVEGDEECDLGGDNADDGVCTSGCKNAFCGDGLVGPGEACDDGNDVDDDLCSNTCAAPGCGDGVVQDPEQCDDGNADDSDACLSTCVDASCGDGFVQEGVEGCDDGNGANDDACTTLCAAPACDDGLLSGDESDVDCGGGCQGCELGGACVEQADCGEGVCVDNACSLAASCAALHDADPQAPSGVYGIDPDGPGGADPFDAYCDMENNGGGWTLVLKADGRNATFAYASALWTDAALHNPDAVDLDHTEAKLAGWNALDASEVMVGLEFPIDDNQVPPVMNYLVLTTAGGTMFDLLSPNTYVATNVGRAAWKALIQAGSLQPNCNMEGFNVIPNANPVHHSVRIGIVGNNENDCGTTDSRIGIGGVGTACATVNDPVGNFAGCGGDAGDKNQTAFGAVFVR
ncbi:MAG: hypothetical protein H6713_38385 [Myxococcales bacterium]|nr:hypothetical protein [Myxococcales bacterium]